jgi:hypothetical protein
MQEVETYGDLLRVLLEMADDELDQLIQIAEPGPNGDEPVELKHGIAIGTVASMEFPGARSTHDNCYHADEVVLLVDGNPFAPDGAIAYEFHSTLEEMEKHPIYGKNGRTPSELQMAPKKG